MANDNPTQMTKGKTVRVYTLMRLTHTYTGLFLIPWLLVYGTSAFCLNHGPWITQTFPIAPAQWETILKSDFTPDDTFPGEPQAQAQAIMQHLNLEGMHRILPASTPNRMIILRPSGAGNYRITWQRATAQSKSQLQVEKQPFSAYRLLHFLHFRGGYGQKYVAHITWAVIVDLVAVSMWLWVVSGIYIWFRHKRERLSGNLCLAAGCLLFCVLVVMLCL